MNDFLWLIFWKISFIYIAMYRAIYLFITCLLSYLFKKKVIICFLFLNRFQRKLTLKVSYVRTRMSHDHKSDWCRQRGKNENEIFVIDQNFKSLLGFEYS